jgi:hypothetical protein
MKEFMYFLFNRYAKGYEPTDGQYQKALLDFKRSKVPTRTTEISNLNKRRKPLNIVVKGAEESE